MQAEGNKRSGWNFSLEELSFGYYEIVAINTDGRQIKHSGTDLDYIKKKCFDDLLIMEELE